MFHLTRSISAIIPRTIANQVPKCGNSFSLGLPQGLACLAPRLTVSGATTHGYHSFGMMHGRKTLVQPTQDWHRRTAALLIAERGLKTKKAAAKRFIKTGKGGLKRGKAYKGHLTSKKTSERKRRLNKKVNLVGTTLKKMKTLLL